MSTSPSSSPSSGLAPTGVAIKTDPSEEITSCYSRSDPNKCQYVDSSQSASKACKEIKQKADSLWDDVIKTGVEAGATLNPAYAATAIAQAFGSNNESNSQVIQNVKIQNNT